MDRLTIIDSALSLLGEKPYDNQTGYQRVCDLWFDRVLREANSLFNWTFARKRITLTNPDTATHPDSSAFTLPVDCLTLLYVYHHGTNRKVNNVSLFNRVLVTDRVDAVDIVYTSDISASMQELPDSRPEFCQGCIYLLAARISPVVTGNLEVQLKFEEMARHYFHSALTKDEWQHNSNDNHPLSDLLQRNLAY